MKNNIKPIWYLFLGVIFLATSHLSFNVDLLAWISMVPFLMYLNRTSGWKSRVMFILALIIAWSLIISKIVTPPITYLIVFLYSIPISLFHLPGYLIWDRLKKQPWSILVFPSVMTIMEWIQYTFTPFASWGVAAYTQSHNLYLMQSVSLLGLPGLSFLVYWINSSAAEIAVKRKTTMSTFQIPLTVLIALTIFGALRYDISKSEGVDTISVAAVLTDSKVSGLPLPSRESNDSVKAALFSRTRLAARCNVQLAVWNEAATFCLPEDEPIWKDSLTSLAAELNISLVASYTVPVSKSPLKYENKYLLIDSTGKILYTYRKHQPVPGEPAIIGKEPQEVFDVAGTKTGAAICYDYDFPYLAKGFGKLKADIVAVPSSDWRGIDPLHSRMAAFRALEQGHSILRSTRFGLSAAITPYGEIISQMSSFDKNNKIMIAHLPVKGVTTVYSVIGDSFIYLCLGFMVFFLIHIFRSRNPPS